MQIEDVSNQAFYFLLKKLYNKIHVHVSHYWLASMGSLYQSVTHCVSSLFWCKCHELSAYLVSYIAMMVREDELIGFSI